MRESKRNSPYVLSDDLIGGVFEVKVDEIRKQRHFRGILRSNSQNEPITSYAED